MKDTLTEQDLLDIGFTEEAISEMEIHTEKAKEGDLVSKSIVDLYNYIICEFNEYMTVIPNIVSNFLTGDDFVKRKFVYVYNSLATAPEDIRKSVIKDMIQSNITHLPLDTVCGVFDKLLNNLEKGE